MATDYTTTIQIIQMLRMLDQRYDGKLQIATIAERLEVSERTVRRWVKMLEGIEMESGAPLITRQRDSERRVWVVLTRPKAPLSANIFQYAAVSLATGALHSPLVADSAEGLLNDVKLTSQQLMKRIKTAFYYHTVSPRSGEDEEILDLIIRATIYRHPVDIIYQKASIGEPQLISRTIEPWTIVAYHEGLYVFCCDRYKGTPSKRLYAVQRIASATVDWDKTFRIPADWNPSAYWENTIGIWRSDFEERELVEIAFEPQAARAAKERKQPGLIGWRRLEDGREVMQLEVAVNREMKRWIMSWGDSVEVLAPHRLREEIQDDLGRMMSVYLQNQSHHQPNNQPNP